MEDSALTAKKAEEGKISQAALHLQYLFELGVDFIDRVIRITDDIEPPLFHIIDAAISEMERTSKKTITIRIYSFGGSVYEALAIVGRIKSSRCHIVTECYGTAQSAATLILAAGDRRRMSEYAFVMHHCGAYVLEGKHPENKVELQQSERLERAWANWMAKFTSKDSDFWYQTGLHTNAYFSAQDCLELGLIDEIF